MNRNVRSAICKQFERTRPRFFRSTGKTIPSKFNCPQYWAEILSSLSQKQSPSSAFAECLRLPYESCSRAQPHVQMSDVTGTWQSKSNQNMRATHRSSWTDHYIATCSAILVSSIQHFLLKMTSEDALGKSLWKETVFLKSTCIQTPFTKLTNGANMQQTYKQLCLAVKPHPPLLYEPTPRLVDPA